MSTQTATFTEVYFHHINGGSILKQGVLNPSGGPVLSPKEASPYRIVPLNDMGKPMSSSCWTMSDRAVYSDRLRSEEWRNVAIQNEDGKFLSCRKKHRAGGALAEYRDEIDIFEKFIVEYNNGSKTFAFKSHNGLYLHYNHYLGIIAFKEREKEVAGWIINPFKLQDPSNDRIRFVGVVHKEGEFFMQKNCVAGARPAWNSDVMLKNILGTLSEKMSSMALRGGTSACTIFDGEDGENTWYVTMTKEGFFNLVIASADCPSYIGTMCVEQIETVYDKNEDINRETALEKLMTDLANQYQFSKTGVLKDKIKSYEDKMTEHITKLQENNEHAQDLVGRCEEMKNLGRKCYEKLEQLPGDKWTRGAKKAPDVLVQGVANMAGSFAGSKIGNKIFGQNANHVVDITSNLEQERNGPIAKFWSRRFVSVGVQIGEIEVDLTPASQVNGPIPPFMPSSIPPPVPSAPPLEDIP